MAVSIGTPGCGTDGLPVQWDVFWTVVLWERRPGSVYECRLLLMLLSWMTHPSVMKAHHLLLHLLSTRHGGSDYYTLFFPWWSLWSPSLKEGLCDPRDPRQRPSVRLLVVAEGSRQLIGQDVPALHPLAFVLQTVHPVTEAVALRVTAQTDATCRTQTASQLWWCFIVSISLWSHDRCVVTFILIQSVVEGNQHLLKYFWGTFRIRIQFIAE